jgi:hypothetical protein
MNNFIASGAENRSPEDRFCLRINTDFHETLCLAFLKGAAYSAHWIFRGECTTPGLPSNMDRVRAGDRRLRRDAARIYTSAAEFVPFDDGDCLSCGRKPRRQGRTCLARPNDDGVEVLHAASAPSMWSLPSLAASSGVLPF